MLNIYNREKEKNNIQWNKINLEKNNLFNNVSRKS